MKRVVVKKHAEAKEELSVWEKRIALGLAAFIAYGVVAIAIQANTYAQAEPSATLRQPAEIAEYTNTVSVAPATTSKPKYTGVCAEWYDEVAKYDWDVNVALAVMRAESGCRADADNTGMNKNGTVDYGLFQINTIHGYSKETLFDPAQNIAIAYKIYKGRGNWSAWCAYNSGSYKRFLQK